MSFNLIDSAKGLFTSEMVNKVSAYLGESENGVAKAIGGILPVLLGGLVHKASDKEGAAAVASMAQDAHQSGIAANFANLSADSGGLLSKGTELLNGLFGAKAEGLSNLISGFAGVKSSAASSLMSMAAPAVLGLIGKHASENNLNAAALANMLRSQQDAIAAAMPAGLNAGSLLGNVNSHSSNTAKAVTAAASTHVSEAAENSGGAMRYLFPVVLLALLAMGAYYMFGKGCNKEAGAHEGSDNTHVTETMPGAETATAASSAGSLDTLTGNFNYNLGKMISIELPNGAGKLEVGEYSTENKLYTFLSDKNATLDTVKGNWFEFTNVRFKTGGAEILDESMNQLKHMVAITKAFPAAQFKLGGYTDNTGSAAGNIALSQKRADAVAAMLVKLGADAKSIAGAKGYGPEWPVADNATAEGRAQNRRVAVNVKAK